MPRRDVGNEVIVALAAIGMLALALTFGVVLTLSRSVATPQASATGTSSTNILTEQAATAKAVANLPVSATATKTATTTATIKPTVAPSATKTNTKQPSATPSLTITQKPSATNTPLPTKTATTTNTPSTVPTNTITSTATNTATATEIPTEVPTLAPPPTETPTETSVPPLTLQPTSIGLLPSPVSSPTDLLAKTFTLTPTATLTATNVPRGVSPTPGVLLLPTIDTGSTRIPGVNCSAPAGWVKYTIQQGDTLFNIGRQAGVTVQDLQDANCIDDPSTIFAGETILVPPGKVITGGGTPGGGGVTSTTNSDVCPNPNVRITSPVNGSTFSSAINVMGTAQGTNFKSYQMEFLGDLNKDWVNFGLFSTPVTNGLLARLDPGPGHLAAMGYSLRLTVVTSSRAFQCKIHVTLVK